MAIVLTGHMLFPDSGDVLRLRSAAEEVTLTRSVFFFLSTFLMISVLTAEHRAPGADNK